MDGRFNIPLFVLFVLFLTGCTNRTTKESVQPVFGLDPQNFTEQIQTFHGLQAPLDEVSESDVFFSSAEPNMTDGELTMEEDIPDGDSTMEQETDTPEVDFTTEQETDIPEVDFTTEQEPVNTSQYIYAPRPEPQPTTPTTESAEASTSPANNQPPREPPPAYSGPCVDQTGSNEITLFWEHPSMNEDGSPLINLAGYRVFYGKHSDNLSKILDVGANTNPTIYNLDPGIWYFKVKSYNTEDMESKFSNEACAAL